MITIQNSITKEEAVQTLSYLIDLHRFYIKTEFFYTDKAFALKDNAVVNKNLEDIDYVKNSGREHLNKTFFGDQSWINLFLNIIAAQFKVDRKLANQLTHQEIIALFDGNTINVETLSEREKSYVSDYDSSIELYGTESEEYIQKILARKDEKVTTLKGAIANKGFVQGKARVFIYGYENWNAVKDMLDEMIEGEILVAETTSPELMVACKKASAILTNQGGMMSHAAIISRELNIPCVVGIGNATQMIKTGDHIEVNANIGEIQIKTQV